MSKIITRAEVAYSKMADGNWLVTAVGSGAALFVTSTVEHIDAQLNAYSTGLVAGMDAGRAAMQMEIREALGFV